MAGIDDSDVSRVVLCTVVWCKVVVGVVFFLGLPMSDGSFGTRPASTLPCARGRLQAFSAASQFVRSGAALPFPEAPASRTFKHVPPQASRIG